MSNGRKPTEDVTVDDVTRIFELHAQGHGRHTIAGYIGINASACGVHQAALHIVWRE